MIISRHPAGPTILLALLATFLLLTGCSDDETITDPVDDVEVPDPFSYVWQINALPDGTVFAVGVEGDAGLLYSNQGGIWARHESQPSAGAVADVSALFGVLPISLTDIYVFAQPASILHGEEGAWISQTMAAAPPRGTLEQTASGRWLLGSEGILLKEDSGQWNLILDTDDPDSYLADITESSDGTVFVSEVFGDQATGRVHRINLGVSTVADDFETPVYALAATGSDTVWAGGARLSYFADAAWDTAVSIPDSNLVVAIGQPGDGSLTLICQNGVIYRWSNDVLSVVQEFAMRSSLASIRYVNETAIYGSLNYTDDNTGHDTGIIVRFDGTQWVPVFLAPPS